MILYLTITVSNTLNKYEYDIQERHNENKILLDLIDKKYYTIRKIDSDMRIAKE